MVSSSTIITTLLMGASTIVASPTLVSRDSVTPLSAEEVADYKPYALLARAAFCPRTKLTIWSCGTACKDLPGMDVKATSEGGVGEADCEVRWVLSPLNTIVVSNQGTSLGEAASSLTDADFYLAPLDQKLFPGIPSSVEVHNGFQMDQVTGAIEKLKAVKALQAKYETSSITCTGLGRGGAIAFLDAIYFSLHIPHATMKVVTHGMPRVGNQAFADYIDSNVSNLSRITNQKDPLPILPGQFLGYHHSSGEKHIVGGSNWVACAGQDNTDSQCSAGAVPNIFEGHPGDNSGPYDGITINGMACDA